MTFLACAASVAVFFAGVTLALSLGAADADVERSTAAMSSLANPIGILVTALSQLTSLVVVWLAAGRSGMRREVLRLGGGAPGWGTCVLAGLAVVALTGALELVLYASFGFDPFADAKWLDEGLRSPVWLGTALVAVLLAPVWEEFAFRGFLLSALARTPLGFWPAALVANTLWTLLHWGYSYAGIASVFAAGLALSWLMWRWGSMRAVVVAHGLANVAALVFVYFFAPAL